MTTIILIRHGHVDGINPPRFRGQHPLPLTQKGVEQAKLTAERIASTWRAAVVLTSPLGRCVETGRAIAAACGVQSNIIDSLIDLDYGEWRWRTHDEVRRQWPEQFALWRDAPHLVRFPLGGCLQDIVLSSANAFRDAIQRFPNQAVVLVGHDSVNRALLLQLLDQPLSAYWRLAQDPCCINVIEYERNAVRILAVNDTRHLTSPGSH